MKEKNEKTLRGNIDPALVAKAKAGDQTAVTELYQQTYTGLYRSIRSMVHDEDLAWDILQDSYLKAFQNLDKLEADGAFLNWLRRIAVNETARQMSKRLPTTFTELNSDEEDESQPELPALDPSVQPELALDRKETARLVQEILGELPEQQRLVIGMRYYEDMSLKEIAELLRVSVGTVKAQLHYGRNKVETRVRALEKQGLKLYGLAPFPFLLALLRNLEPAEAAGQKALCAVMAQAPAAAGNAVLGSTAAAGSGAVKMTAMTAGQAIRHGMAAKLTAGALALCMIGGGVFAGSKLWKADQQKMGDHRLSATETTFTEQDPIQARPYFVEVTEDSRSYFTNERIEVWQEGGEILEKDLATGETSTLFSVETEENDVNMIKSKLIAVTDKRLYFGWEYYEFYGACHAVYSVDYRNQNRIELSGNRRPSFQNGMLILNDSARDTTVGEMDVFDCYDRNVVDLKFCWASAMVDGCFYYVYAPIAQEWDSPYQGKEKLSEEELEHTQYELRRVDPDGTVTVIGSFEMVFNETMLEINPETREIILWRDAEDFEGKERLDLFTLRPKLSNLALDKLDLSMDVGADVIPIRVDSEAVIFYTYFGIFGYDGTTMEPLFTVDLDKAVDRDGNRQTQGDRGVFCVCSQDGKQILVGMYDLNGGEVPDYCLIDLETQTYQMLSEEPADFAVYPDIPMERFFWVVRMEGLPGLVVYLNGAEWRPFQAK